MKKFLSILLLLPTLAFAQATTAYHRFDRVLARGTGVAVNVQPYSTVAVTNTATGLAGAIFVDPGLTVPYPNSVVTADANGNYNYYFALQTCMTEKVTYPNGGSQTIVNICSNTSPGGTVSSFSAPALSWPTWLTPTVTNGSTTPSLAVAASPIPNSALANSTLTLGSSTLTLGGTTLVVSGLTIDSVTPTIMGYVDFTSSGQGQLNGKASSTAGTTVNGVLCTLSSTCTITAAAGSLAGGALGSLPYQSAPSTTAFIVSPTTTGHTFVPAWQPSGSAIAPTAIDLTTFLNTYLTAPGPIGGTTPAAGSFSSLKDTGAAAGSGYYGLQIDTAGAITNTGVASVTGIDQYQLNYSMCAPTTSTDAGCTGSVTLSPAYADTSYEAFVQLFNTAGAFLNVTLTSKSTGSFGYSLSCSYNCGTIGTVTADIHTHHN
jgi:hypothetical protein